MPNHFHGIIGIGENRYNTLGTDHGTNGRGRDARHRVSTFGPQSKNLGSFIRGFKSGVTVGARLINPDFGWQDRFHDHIIRDKKSFHRISEYIKNNIRNWSDDGFHDK
ncbi:hypothetical protein SAMN05661096_03794 [Marivirga sericea]|uniref:Transposase IS200 like n=1 Tax=Marivirga sericea TaxID=1028 RepID=A0A1X7LE36_9BACT|nr:hypothetical protein SAMN05661096_03794 [Marivirga sericea]